MQEPLRGGLTGQRKLPAQAFPLPEHLPTTSHLRVYIMLIIQCKI